MTAEEIRKLMKDPYEEIMDKITKAATHIKPKHFINVQKLSEETIIKLQKDGFNVDYPSPFSNEIDYKISW